MSDNSTILEKTNVYEINEVDVSTQKETTWENILEYFNSYIRTYVPYKDEPTYKAMVSFIIKYYVDQIYNVQPEIFKDMFENQTIRTELVDLLLVSIGLPESVIRSITTTSKFIILKSFSDFERYQGTVKFFRSIGGSFSDTISFYELYIDYDKEYVNPVGEYLVFVDKDNITPGSYFLISSTDTNFYVWFNYNNSTEDPGIETRTGLEINYDDSTSSDEIAQLIIHKLNDTDEFYVNVNGSDIVQIQLIKHGPAAGFASSGTTRLDVQTVTEGKVNGAWILRPRPIFLHPKMEQLKETVSYRAAYNKIPTLLIPEEQLEEMKSKGEIILPTKSNIVMMDYTRTIEASMFNTLVFTILMETIGDDPFTIYLTDSDGTTTITYNTAIYTWFYLLAKYYGVTLEGVSAAHHIVMGTRKTTNYTLEDLETIQKEYDNIKYRDQMISFYNEYYSDQFGRYYEAEKPTVEMMSETLKKLDLSFWQYIEDRIDSAEDREQDIRFLLDEIYASLVLSFRQYNGLQNGNPIIYKYIPVLLQFLTHVTIDIKKTDSYKIVYNLKPFHTEFLDLAHDKIVVEDKFNALLLDDEKLILFELALADLLHMSDEAIFTFTPKKDGDSLGLYDGIYQYLRAAVREIFEVSDSAVPIFIKTPGDILEMSDRSKFSFSPKEKESMIAMIDKLSQTLEFSQEAKSKIEDLAKSIFLKTPGDILEMSDGSKFSFSPKEKESMVSIIDGLSQIFEFMQQSKNVVDENKKMHILQTFLSAAHFFNKINFRYSPEKNIDKISFIDRTSLYLKSKEKSDADVHDYLNSDAALKLTDDIPYTSSDNACFTYEIKDSEIGIIDNAANDFSFLKKSNITLTDSIRINKTRSRNNV